VGHGIGGTMVNDDNYYIYLLNLTLHMMDKLNDLFTEFKERFSSPLFSSFIIAWCFINWQIPIALIFYKNNELHADGFKSFIHLICARQGTWNMLIEPGLFAIGYVILYPLLKTGIFLFNSWVDTKGTETNFKITGESKIPVNKYIELRTKYIDTTKSLEDIIVSQSDFKVQNSELTSKNAEVESRNLNLTSGLRMLDLGNKINSLLGEWVFTKMDRNLNEFGPTESLIIEVDGGGNLTLQNKNGSYERYIIIKIIRYKDNLLIAMTKFELHDSTFISDYWLLTYNPSEKKYVGNNSNNGHVTLQRNNNSIDEPIYHPDITTS
jgi:hypothetical protein